MSAALQAKQERLDETRSKVGIHVSRRSGVWKRVYLWVDHETRVQVFWPPGLFQNSYSPPRQDIAPVSYLLGTGKRRRAGM